ncbi:hypothetical protein [Consotaella aegiceratis]|uniref:hypothetical protein n=1 Tax=Consotaella aegiceratis TaxID=3097961 RepID=UPI002F40A9D4
MHTSDSDEDEIAKLEYVHDLLDELKKLVGSRTLLEFLIDMARQEAVATVRQLNLDVSKKE